MQVEKVAMREEVLSPTMTVADVVRFERGRKPMTVHMSGQVIRCIVCRQVLRVNFDNPILRSLFVRRSEDSHPCLGLDVLCD